MSTKFLLMIITDRKNITKKPLRKYIMRHEGKLYFSNIFKSDIICPVCDKNIRDRKMHNFFLPFLRRRAASYSFTERKLHTVNKFIAPTQNEQIGAVLLQTHYDKKSNENENEYYQRSYRELVEQIPSHLHGKELLLLRLNQTVIDANNWNRKNEVTVKYIGHLIAGIFKIANGKLNCVNNLLMSKTPQGYADTMNILNSHFFMSQHQFKLHKKTGAREYYLLVDLNLTSLNLNDLIQRLQSQLDANAPYQLFSDACGQAVFKWLTDKVASTKISPQTAARHTIFEILRSEDRCFANNLKDMFTNSGFSRTAFEIDRSKKYDNIEPHNDNTEVNNSLSGQDTHNHFSRGN